MSGPGERIYVGYLPMTPGQRRFVRIAAPAMLWILCVLSGVMVLGMRDPGDAVWHTESPRAWTGVLRAAPYPMLETVDERGDARTLLVVEVGKIGSQRRLSHHDGARATLTGWLLERDGRRMIELEESGEAVEIHAGSGAGPAHDEPLGEVSLRGEIVDIKCFLGAMKPGDGKAHRACAALCIAGGVPPVLVTREPGGVRRYCVLTDSDGRSARDLVQRHIAEPVVVRGLLSRRGDMLLLSVEGVLPDR